MIKKLENEDLGKTEDKQHLELNETKGATMASLVAHIVKNLSAMQETWV